MAGTKAWAFSLIEVLTLDDLFPTDHCYRHLDRSLDLSFVRELVTGCPAAVGPGGRSR
jgi:hypothetical protein